MPRNAADVPDDVLSAVLRGVGADADAVEERRRMRSAGAQLVVLGDPDYPAQLAMIPDPPRGLWVRGDLHALGAVPIAIVGARRATAYGTAQAGRFAAHLAEQGVAIVSGGARGIDAEAHRAALRVRAPTVAVIGCGLGAGPYPPEHGGLYEAIVEAGGLLLSEFPTCYPIRPDNFPRRNRIISGVSMGVVVIEASVTSGALITARMAVGEHNRPAFALPGPVDSTRSEGCNRAIRDGEAHLVLSPEEVYDEVVGQGLLFGAGARLASHARQTAPTGSAAAPARAVPAATVHTAGLPEDMRGAVPAVRAFLERDPGADCALIVEHTGLPAHAVQAALTVLALERPRDAPTARGARGRR